MNFSDRVVVAGTPQLALSVGVNTRNADYARGTNSNQLVFEYTVVEADADTDGIVAGQNGLALNGGAITSVYGAQAILTHTALAAQTGHKVDGSLTPGIDLTLGICDRTRQVRDKLVELVNANDSDVSNCSEVDPDNPNHLAALTGTLNLGDAGIATLKRGDFANLGGIGSLRLENNDLTALPAGVFEGLDDTLINLSLTFNDLQTIPAGVFDGLTGLVILNLSDNDLASLPPRIFEKLTGLTELYLSVNPGSARFVPTAKAGPEGGFDVASGGSVTLGVDGAENGFDDPWGDNVEYEWTPPAGTTVTYTDGTTANSPRPAFTVPATGEDVTHVFRLTATGRGRVLPPPPASMSGWRRVRRWNSWSSWGRRGWCPADGRSTRRASSSRSRCASTGR